MKKIIIRTDASVDIGSGHVMRCLTIAHSLKREGCHIQFWMEPHAGNLLDYVAQQGYEIISKAEHADLYIIDHYGIDMEWEQNIRPYTKKLMVIDDLARVHDCDLLLDQNVVPNFEDRYDELLPKHCIKLLGPKYLIMREEFIEARRQIRQRNQDIQRLLVFMGGTDPTNETMKILTALEELTFAHVDVVVGNGNVHKEKIEQICRERNYHYHCQISYMAQLMQQADFSIGAGGSSMWERCYVGLPSSSTIVANNQLITTNYADQLGAVINLGWHEDVTVDTYKHLLNGLGDVDVVRFEKIVLQLTATSQPNAWLSQIMELLA
ncbi:UDP-2,4-diacetamido-2,4,6-trideoxy-beta-L-altropyranose hydrolase [Lysinibacillus irui]|uniref:UDP-2,4-diacetamido-2,4, 6-trideoxy-beta-L-altropyranose hydrolase n=1 Tax=Lysinibacillus irui TaxID=2998077 RepID=A0ABU5NG26_9BACI|nr:UDP-2,4-diacetamido-2,4,6-trideoxy-beta-L-altropyranose hydrolase [Lysinibacillus irui]MEA0554071.1 UDP-2,4-diacetamido-2,4,6-trideoxy-beta-L-altropyranose hydrolase [Lysinibacillus irui]MEA0974987.1 UDP-2,4-diacetamido-2,4,6-trideoxy-beta-L-altropyranose hydrolase [Lysinibacillus irui]MEA1041141.1 UDP-2,4-diacetamido-2,4,6-trideoxy-beta-L-altropyranose hydrolase [Lysinibacillus irui]